MEKKREVFHIVTNEEVKVMMYQGAFIYNFLKTCASDFNQKMTRRHPNKGWRRVGFEAATLVAAGTKTLIIWRFNYFLVGFGS